MAGLKENKDGEFIVVIGTSAGGLAALKKLVGQFKEDFPAPVVIVVHLPSIINPDFIVGKLKPVTILNVLKAEDRIPLTAGNIYVAVPDIHVLAKKNYLLSGYGPEENRWRPSIDVLFRSAAVSYGQGCIGIILTGLLNDGTAGMEAIQRCGGVTIVQDPGEAEFPDMPLNVLENIETDNCLTLDQIVPALEQIVTKKINGAEIPEDILAESEIIEKMLTDSMAPSRLGQPSIYACPDCGGMLWEIKSKGLTRYRCHIGHSYTGEDLLVRQAVAMQSTLWIALRIMEERKSLLVKIENQNIQKGYKRIAKEYRAKADELDMHIQKLKQMLIEEGKNNVSNLPPILNEG